MATVWRSWRDFQPCEIKRTYYDRSPYARIVALMDGRFLVERKDVHMVTEFEGYEDAASLRQMMALALAAQQRQY